MKRYLLLLKEAWTEFHQRQSVLHALFDRAAAADLHGHRRSRVFGKSQAQAQIIGQLRTLTGGAGAKAIEGMLVSASRPKAATLAIVIGVLTLLFGAAGVFGQLNDALNTIWNVEEKKSAGIMAVLRERFLSFAMVLGVGFLLLASLGH